MKKIIVTLTALFMTLSPAFSTQKLIITGDNPYLMLFDKKISKVTTDDNSCVKFEILNSILNDKQELLIKPIKPANTAFIVWNGDKKTSFELQILKPDAIDNILGEMELDKPAGIEENGFTLKIDKPPVARATKK